MKNENGNFPLVRSAFAVAIAIFTILYVPVILSMVVSSF